MNEPSASLVESFAPTYRVERELGRGATAKVYLAEDVKHQRRVAIKVLREEIAESIGTERFLQEIMVAAGLSHPHIVPLLDSGERVALEVKAGDRILFGKYSGAEIRLDGAEYLILREDEILGVVE